MPPPNENYPNRPSEPGIPLLFWLTIIGLASLSGVLYFRDDKLGAASMIPLGLGACMGYRSGAWKMFSMMLGSIAGFYFAAPTSVRLIPWIESTFHQTISNPIMGLAISGVAVGALATLLAMFFGWIVIRRIEWLDSIDRNLGMFVGIAKSFAIIAVGLWTVLALEPRMIKMRGGNSRIEQSTSGSLYHRFLNVADATRKSPSLSLLASWNPMAENQTFKTLLDKAQSMVLDAKSQVAAAQSGGIVAHTVDLGLD